MQQNHLVTSTSILFLAHNFHFHLLVLTNFKIFSFFVCLFPVLCGNRVSQMTRTYDDIEAVTRLLEEKEKDLELTVQIGKELLTQNTRLENRVAELEGEVKVANENLAQLTYEVHTKSALLAALTNDEEAGSESSKYFVL